MEPQGKRQKGGGGEPIPRKKTNARPEGGGTKRTRLGRGSYTVYEGFREIQIETYGSWKSERLAQG